MQAASSCWLLLQLTWIGPQIFPDFHMIPVDFEWITTLIQMKYFREKLIFEVRISIKIKINSVIWFNIVKFCHFNSGSDNVVPPHPVPSAVNLWMVERSCHNKIWDFGCRSWRLQNKWLAEFVVFVLISKFHCLCSLCWLLCSCVSIFSCSCLMLLLPLEQTLRHGSVCWVVGKGRN